jgi:hypothetical protein
MTEIDFADDSASYRVFGLCGPTAALATVVNCIVNGFQRGTRTRWQLVANVGTVAPPPTDMGASFGIAMGGVLTLFIAAPPNSSSVWVRVADDVAGAIYVQAITAERGGLPCHRGTFAKSPGWGPKSSCHERRS